MPVLNHSKYLQRSATTIKVLYIEHNLADIDLTKRHLARYAPFIQIESVFTAEDALQEMNAVEERGIYCNCQVIVLDYRISGMGALEFVKIVRQEKKCEIPIIIVTGQGSEEVAVQALKLGADEYLMKRENYLYRLPSLIMSAYQHFELLQKQKALTESETKYRLLAENPGDGIFSPDFDLNFTYVSPAVFKLRGFTVDEVLQQNIFDTLTPDSMKKVQLLLDTVLPEILAGNQPSEPIITELQTYRKDNSLVWVEVTATLLYRFDRNPAGILGVTRDISKRKAAQEELRKLSRAVIQSPVSITITDVNGNIEYVNPQFTKITGYTSEEVLGKTPRLLKSGTQPDSYYKNLWDTILSGNEWRDEFQDLRKNGELFWVNTNISPLFNNDGKITHFVAVNEDIKERKKNGDKLKLYTKAIEQSPVSLNITDSNGDIIYVNSGFTALSGYTSAEVIGRNPRFLKSGVHTNDFYRGLWDTLKAGKNWSGELCNKNKEGNLYWVQATISPVVDLKGKITHFIAIKENITEKKKFVEDLKIAKEKAEESDRLKSAFLANMSHEIRTPMNGILGFTELLLEPDLNSEQKEQFIEIVHKSGQRMLNTVTDIIEISKIEAGMVNTSFKVTDINSKLEELVTFFKQEASQKGLKLSLKKVLPLQDKNLLTDANMLNSILTNLIKNAIKYTNAGFIEVGCNYLSSFSWYQSYLYPYNRHTSGKFAQ